MVTIPCGGCPTLEWHLSFNFVSLSAQVQLISYEPTSRFSFVASGWFFRCCWPGSWQCRLFLFSPCTPSYPPRHPQKPTSWGRCFSFWFLAFFLIFILLRPPPPPPNRHKIIIARTERAANTGLSRARAVAAGPDGSITKRGDIAGVVT